MTSNFKTFMLMSLMTVLFVFVGGQMGGQSGAIMAFVVAAGMNFYSYWFSARNVLKRYRATEITPGHNSGLYEMVHELAMNANLPMPKVYIIPEATPNAFATGRNPENAAVAATEGILRILDRDELAGVMAHELAHIKNRDILISTVAATFAGALTMIAQFGRFSNVGRRQNPLASILILIGAPLAAMIIRMAISRAREFGADRGGAEISGQPMALASALNKLQHGVQRYPIQRGNPAHANMFIINPFLGNMRKLMSTHPPTEQRIQKLQELSREF